MVKRYDDFSREEMAVLTQDEVDRLIDIECAHLGVPLLFDLPPKPERVLPEKDVTMFGVAGFYFQERSQALSVLDAILENGPIFRTTYDASVEVFEEVDENRYDFPNISPKTLCSRKEAAKLRSTAEAYSRAKEDWDALKKEWDDVKSRRSEVADAVRSRYREAVAWKQKDQELTALFSRYVDLSGGDKNTAMKFLVDATPMSTIRDHVDTLKGLAPDYPFDFDEDLCDTGGFNF